MARLSKREKAIRARAELAAEYTVERCREMARIKRNQPPEA